MKWLMLVTITCYVLCVYLSIRGYRKIERERKSVKNDLEKIKLWLDSCRSFSKEESASLVEVLTKARQFASTKQLGLIDRLTTQLKRD